MSLLFSQDTFDVRSSYLCSHATFASPLELKKAVTILLLTIIVLQTFSSFVIQADYFLNKSYIAKVLCINKEKPMMHCNGKCYLKKRLKEQEQQDQQAPNSKREKFEGQPYFLPENFKLIPTLSVTNIAYCNLIDIKATSFPRSVFRPPSV